MDYGHALRPLWPLAPDWLYLNHGGMGVTPHEVAAVAESWRAQIEANPTRFMMREYPDAIRAVAAGLAAFIGAKAEQVVFLGNATEGVNAVLRSLDFRPGDEIVLADMAYGAVTKAARYVADRSGAKCVVHVLPVPLPDAEAAVAAFAPAITPRTRLVIVDHVASPTGIVLPVRRIAELAHAAGARVLVDGAHAPGQVPLAMTETGADWYVGNLHKWLFAPRACGFLWVADPVRDAIHPLSISHGYGSGMIAEFDWTGTHDPAPVLSVPAAIAFHERLGGGGLMARNAALVREAAALTAAALQMPLGAPPDLFASMGTVMLPERFGTAEADALRLRRRLSDDHRIESVVGAHQGRLWLRLAAQAYNALEDYERLAAVLTAL